MNLSLNKVSIQESHLPIYVGLDVHKKKLSVTLIQGGKILRRATVDAYAQCLESLLKPYQGSQLISVYEAGFCGFSWHRRLEAMGVESHVVSPNKMPLMVGDLVKTDRRDSAKLAVYFSGGLLKSIHVPSPQQLEFKQWMRTRNQLKSKRLSCIHQMKSLLLLQGHRLELKGMNKRIWEEIQKLELNRSVRQSLTFQFENISLLTSQMKALESEAETFAEHHGKEAYDRLRSVPGLGKITALSLLGEIGFDWSHLDNMKSFSAYLGLTPREYSSGDQIRRGRITGQGNPWLRSLLIEACWTAIKYDSSLEKVFQRLSIQTGSKKKAIVAVTRIWMGRVYAMMKKGENYHLPT